MLLLASLPGWFCQIAPALSTAVPHLRAYAKGRTRVTSRGAIVQASADDAAAAGAPDAADAQPRPKRGVSAVAAAVAQVDTEVQHKRAALEQTIQQLNKKLG